MNTRAQVCLFFTAFCVMLSVPKKILANTSEPYAVGSSTLFIYDKTRPFDQLAGVNVGARTLITEVWYPVSREVVKGGDYSRATYGDYSFNDKDVHRRMLTQTTFFHLTPDSVVEDVSQKQIDAAIDELFYRQRSSYIDAPVLSPSNGAKWPIVVMTHGDAGSRYNMETACEYLASQGYVVIAPEHTGNSPFSFVSNAPDFDAMLSDVSPFLNADGTYGSVDKYGQTYTPLVSDSNDPKALEQLDDALIERVNDLRAVLSELDKMNLDGRFKGKLDLEKIGLMGRSFGGTTTLAALALEPRFTAGFAVVPLVLPDVRAAVPASYLKPKGKESLILSAKQPSLLSIIEKPTFLLSGAEDSLIIGVGASMASAFGGVMPNADNPFPELRASYKESLQPVIWGMLAESNHGSFGVSGPYWWPTLKASTQAKFFNSEESFELISSETAHEIQKVSTLQFFNTFLLGSTDAREQLLNNEFKNDGLVLEARNITSQRP